MNEIARAIEVDRYGPEFTNADWVNVEREYCSRSLRNYAKRAWSVVEPSTPMKWGWCLDAICDHLMAVHNGELTKVLMNVPPGSMKSLLSGVMFPSFEWGPGRKAHMRFLGTAHKEALAVRDNLKCRRIVKSEWFQTLWPISVLNDQDSKTKFENDKTGFREAMAFTSMTGSRGDRILLDDPHSVDGSNSDQDLANVEKTFTEALPTRLNDPDKSAIIVIMQRLHMRDVSGIIMEREFGYTHLCLPMEYEPERKCYTSIGFEDPRTEPGELMFPERFSAKAVESLKKELGEYAAAGQLQQSPTPRGGGLFKKDWFESNIISESELPNDIRWVRGWDLAGSTRKNSPYTVGVKMGYSRSTEMYYVANVKRFRGSPHVMESTMKTVAKNDGRRVTGTFPQDPAQAGKYQAGQLLIKMRPYTYKFSTETGSKFTRAEPLASEAEAGHVKIVRGAWNHDYIEEMSQFPRGRYADQVDASSRAFEELASRSRYTLDNV